MSIDDFINLQRQKTYSFYDETTGIFAAHSIFCPDFDLDRNTPNAHQPIEGRFDHLSQRVDITARNAALEAARNGFPAKVQAARDAFDARIIALSAQHDSDQEAAKAAHDAAIANAKANNSLVPPTEFMGAPFVVPVFLEPVWNEMAETNTAASASVVDYKPPQPSPDHEWNAVTKRWQLTVEAQARKTADAQARGQIQRLEIQQARVIRELMLGDTSARDRLQVIDDQIVELRKNVVGS